LKKDKRKNKRYRESWSKGMGGGGEIEIFAVFNTQKLASSNPYFGSGIIYLINYSTLFFVSGRVGRSFLQVGLTHNRLVRYTALLNLWGDP
jgi:hypothetical protein